MSSDANVSDRTFLRPWVGITMVSVGCTKMTHPGVSGIMVNDRRVTGPDRRLRERRAEISPKDPRMQVDEPESDATERGVGVVETVRAYFTLFTPDEVRGFARVVAISLAVALVQALSVASVMPFLALVADPSVITRNGVAQWLYDAGGFEAQESFLVATGLAVVVALVFANVVMALGTRAGLRFVWDQHHRLSSSLMEHYLRLPYLQFSRRHTSNLAQNLLDEVSLLGDGVAMPIVTIVTDGAVAIVLFGLMAFIEPSVAFLAVGALGAAYVWMFLAVRKRQRHMGEERLRGNKARFRTSHEALSGVKEIILNERQDAFLGRFKEASRAFSINTRRAFLMGLLPRYLMEVLAFGGVVLVTLYFILTGDGVANFLPVLGLYALAGYKGIPAAQHVFQSLSRLEFSGASVTGLAAQFHTETNEGPQPRPLSPPQPSDVATPIPNSWTELRVSDLRFTYPGADAPVLDGLNLRVPRNTSLALVGSTGSGKSTLAHLILGLFPAESGTISLDDQPLDASRLTAWRKILGYVPQDVFMLDESILANVAFGLSGDEIDVERAERALAAANVDELVRGLPEGLHTALGERGARFSGGKRQRIALARALYREPQILVLDEATSALDTVTELSVMKALQELSGAVTMLIIAHRLSTVRECDQIALIDEGRAVAVGSFEELRDSEPKFAEFLRSGGLERRRLDRT